MLLCVCVRRKVFLKHQVNSNRVCGAMQDLPWRNIWPVGNPVEVLNEHLLLLVGRFGPIKVFSFRSSEVKCLLLDLDPYVVSDPLGMFPLFPKTTADVLAPGLSVVFRRLVRLGIVSQLAGDRPISPYSKGSTIFLCSKTKLFIGRMVDCRRFSCVSVGYGR